MILRLSFALVYTLVFFASAFASDWDVTGRNDSPIVSLQRYHGANVTPILIVYTDGTLIWSPDYFSIPFNSKRREPSLGVTGPTQQVEFTEEQLRERELRAEAIKEILAGIDPDDPNRAQALLSAAQRHPSLAKPPLKSERYLVSQTSPEVVAALVDVLYRASIHQYAGFHDGIPTRDAPFLSARLTGPRVPCTAVGPFGHFFDPEVSFDSVLDGDHFTESANPLFAWQDLITAIASVLNSAIGEPISELSSADFQHRRMTWLPILRQATSPRDESTLQNVRGVSKAVAPALTRAQQQWSEGAQLDAITALESVLLQTSDSHEMSVIYEQLATYYLALGDHDDTAAFHFKNALLHSTVPSANSLLRLGYLSLKNNSSRSTALHYFVQVSHDIGPLAGTPEELREGKLGAVTLLRRLRHEELADQLFDDLQALSISDTIGAQAALQRIEFTLERAKGDFGDRDISEVALLLRDTRSQIDEFLARESIALEQRAVAELMRAQTYYYEENYTQCAIESAAFERKWLAVLDQELEGDWNPKRYIVTALTFRMMSLLYTKQYHETIAESEKIRNNYSTDDPYPAFNSFAYSYLYEGLAYEALGLSEQANDAYRFCRSHYPGWYGAHAGRKIETARERLAR